MQGDNESFQKKVRHLSNNNANNLLFVSELTLQLNSEIAKKLNISDERLNEILEGKRKVNHIVYDTVAPRTLFRHITGRTVKALARITVIVLLVLCVFLPGFSDTIRESIVFTTRSPISTNVTMVSYDKYDGSMDSIVLPEILIEGFEYKHHEKLSTVSVVYVLYTDQCGEMIEYYFYQDGAKASYDNEFSQYHPIAINQGNAYVGHTTEDTTVMYFAYDDGFIQMDFSFFVDDETLRKIADNVRYTN